jgi:prevent-host-death family protein
MTDITVTDIARNLSEVLDAVERSGESFRVTRGGRPIARLIPAEAASGRAAKDLLSRHRADDAWATDLGEIRSLLVGRGTTRLNG